VKIDILLDPVDTESGIVKIKLPDRVRAFDSEGLVIGKNELIVDLARPTGKLASLRNGAATLWLEGTERFSSGTIEMQYSHALGLIEDEIELFSTGWVSETEEGSGEFTALNNPVVFESGEFAENSSVQEFIFTDFSPAQTQFGIGLELPGRLDPGNTESAKLSVSGEFVIRADVELDETGSPDSKIFTGSSGFQVAVLGDGQLSPIEIDTIEVEVSKDGDRERFKLQETGEETYIFFNMRRISKSNPSKFVADVNNISRFRIRSDIGGRDVSVVLKAGEQKVTLQTSPSNGGLISDPVIFSRTPIDAPGLTVKTFILKENDTHVGVFIVPSNFAENLKSVISRPVDPMLLSSCPDAAILAAVGEIDGFTIASIIPHLERIEQYVGKDNGKKTILGYPNSTLDDDLHNSELASYLSTHGVLYFLTHGGAVDPNATSPERLDFRGVYIFDTDPDTEETVTVLLKASTLKTANKGRERDLVYMNACAGANNHDERIADAYIDAFGAKSYASYEMPVFAAQAAARAEEFFELLDNYSTVSEAAKDIVCPGQSSSGLKSAAASSIDRPLLIIPEGSTVVIDNNP